MKENFKKAIITSLFLGIAFFSVKSINYSDEIYSFKSANAAKITSIDGKANTDKLTKRKVLSGKISILIPKSFELMSQQDLLTYYPLEDNRPTELYSNEATNVSLSFNHTKTEANSESLANVQVALEKTFDTPETAILKSGMVTINDNEFYVIELIMKDAETDVYNIIFATILEGRLLIGGYDCQKIMYDEYKDFGKEILKSIEIN